MERKMIIALASAFAVAATSPGRDTIVLSAGDYDRLRGRAPPPRPPEPPTEFATNRAARRRAARGR